MTDASAAIVDVVKPPPPARVWTRQRILGTALMGFWVLCGVGLVAYLVSAWNPELYEKYAP